MKPKTQFRDLLLSGLIDFLLFIVLAWSFNKLVFLSPLANNYKNYYYQVITTQDIYKLDSGFGEKTYLTFTNESNFTNYVQYEDEQGTYVVTDLSVISDEIRDTYATFLAEDSTYLSNLDQYRMASIGLLALVVGSAQLILFFFIPITNKRKATLGKLAFNLTTVQAKTNETVKNHLLLAQFLILFVIVSMLPYMILGEFMLIFMPLVLAVVMLFDRDFRTIHQLLGQTKTISANRNLEEGLDNVQEETVV